MIALLLLTLAADLPPSTARTYWAVKPTAAELKWRAVAWQVDLAAAVKLATEERRPLFVWVAGDPPLERC